MSMLLAAHPRRCGENSKSLLCVIRSLGSSPQVRGKLTHVPAENQTRRLIPAGAGKTQALHSPAWLYTAHPRGCGEHFRLTCVCFHLEGSSPRVRGTLSSTVRAWDSHGLIPAGAGNITVNPSACRVSRAHPRGCGEHEQYHSRKHRVQGSSPRVRGTSYELRKLTIFEGLIPAGAGNFLIRV